MERAATVEPGFLNSTTRSGAMAAPPLEIGALYRAHAQTVARWVLRLYGPGVRDVEDLVQEVFLTAHRALPGFRGDAKITTWLFRITHNVVRHRRRRERLRAFWHRSIDGDGPEAAASTPSPSETLERRQAQQRVYQILDGMSEKYRTAFVLFELEGLPGEEIAAMLGTRPATLWVWLHRARAQFTAGLAKLEQAEAQRGADGPEAEDEANQDPPAGPTAKGRAPRSER